jgi:hypothetical protein
VTEERVRKYPYKWILHTLSKKPDKYVNN